MPTDLRTQKLAKLIVNYSVNVKKGEKVIISGGTEAEDFLRAIYKEVILKGAHPIMRVGISGLTPFFLQARKQRAVRKIS
jgi:aminopeptidase